MSFTFVPYSREQHYDVVSLWWEKQNQWIVPVNCLPETGFVILYGEIPIAAGWVYFHIGSASAHVGWIVGNPDSSSRKKRAAIDMLYSKFVSLCDQLGVVALISFVNKTGLAKILFQKSFKMYTPHYMFIRDEKR